MNAFFFMAATKTPMDGASVVGRMISSLAPIGGNLGIMAETDLAQLADLRQIPVHDAAKCLRFSPALDFDDTASFNVAGDRLLIRRIPRPSPIHSRRQRDR